MRKVRRFKCFGCGFSDEKSEPPCPRCGTKVNFMVDYEFGWEAAIR